MQSSLTRQSPSCQTSGSGRERGAGSASTSSTSCTSRRISGPRRTVTTWPCKAVDTELAQAARASSPSRGGARQLNRAVLTASKSGVQAVQELHRPLSEYMSLPASQYSVLDARKIERISDEMFKCYVGELRFISWSAEPVLTVSVTVEPEQQGCTIRLLSCTLKGSQFIEDINDKFDAQMSNVVRWRAVPAAATAAAPASPVASSSSSPASTRSGTSTAAAAASSNGSSSSSSSSSSSKQIVSTTNLRVELEIPAWCSFIPASTIERTGSQVLQNVLNLMVPRFLAQLQNDYRLWATGDQSRNNGA